MILPIIFIVLLVLGVPIGITTGLSSMAAIVSSGIGLDIVVQKIYSGVNSFTLMAIPFLFCR